MRRTSRCYTYILALGTEEDHEQFAWHVTHVAGVVIYLSTDRSGLIYLVTNLISFETPEKTEREKQRRLHK